MKAPGTPLERASSVAIASPPLEGCPPSKNHSTSLRPAQENPDQKTLAQCGKKRIISAWCREPTTPRHT